MEGKGKESSNGSKIGPCKAKPSLTCMEVIDDLKGDVARSYFYLSMAYRNLWTERKVPGVVDKWNMEDWMEKDMLAWHVKDKVNAEELARNEAISNWQKNRNPFIDHPEWVKAAFVEK